MTEVLTSVLGQLGLSAVIAAAVAGLIAWLGHETLKTGLKSYADARLEAYKAELKLGSDRTLEAYKTELKLGSDQTLERLKHDLQLAAREHDVRFSKLQEKRAAVIAETYANLADTYEALKAYTALFEPTGGPSKDDRAQRLREA